MNKLTYRMRQHQVMTLFVVTFTITILGTTLYFLYNTMSQKRSTYSIVAVDPVTGDVGVAGASCVPISATSLAVLVPGQGAAAIQAAFIPDNQTKVFDLLGQGMTANEIIKLMRDDSYDSLVSERQYGIVTLREGNIQVAGYTGEGNEEWAGDRQDSTYAVSVQGNTLESEAVISDALTAFSAADIGSVELPDRLMRALEAASAAGGDRRCNNQSGFQQTAEVAFIIVAKADQPSFITPLGKEPSPNDPALPWLYISVIEAKGGPNPLLELRNRYDTWRSENLPVCADCNLDAIPVPSGGNPNPLTRAILTVINRIGLGLVASLCCLTSILLMIISLTSIFKRRRQRLSNNLQTEKRKFQLYQHPWLSLLAVMVTSVFSIGLTGTVIFRLIGLPGTSPTVQFAQAMSYHILTVFLLAPFVLHLPKGKRAFRQYLDDIGLSKVQSLFRLVLLALSCYVILALSQVAASFVYKLSEGLPIDGSFIRQVFDLSKDLPPGSPSLLISFPAIFEEVAFRGIVLTVFLSKYPERKSIIFSSLGFGLMHLLNLTNGRELVWVMGQVVWAFTIGLFYGYVFVRTRSLLPSMIVHYLGNVFISSLVGYIQTRASIEIQVLYGVVLSLGVVPVTLMILWTRFFSSRWLPDYSAVHRDPAYT